MQAMCAFWYFDKESEVPAQHALGEVQAVWREMRIRIDYALRDHRAIDDPVSVHKVIVMALAVHDNDVNEEVGKVG